MALGFKIKKLREELNLSQIQLAQELKISQSELSKIENGQVKKVDFLLMVKVLNFFEKDIPYFVGENLKTKEYNKVNDKRNEKERLKVFQENIMKEIQLFMGDEHVV
jgi:transcriptional regulator with XRE-family HTH domain